MTRPILHQIAACPFSQRVEILLALRGLTESVEMRIHDVTQPRPADLLAKTGGVTSLPAFELPDGRVLLESLAILGYLDETLPGAPLARTDPWERAVERMMIGQEDGFASAGYRMIRNRDRDARDGFEAEMLSRWRKLGDFLDRRNPGGVFLFDRFGLAETVFTPLMMRFWFLEHYEGFDLPDTPDYARARAWREACLAHPAAQQVTRRQIVTLYADYAWGCGNGALPAGRRISSFAATPPWQERPLPPRDKWGPAPSDSALGLLPA